MSRTPWKIWGAKAGFLARIPPPVTPWNFTLLLRTMARPITIAWMHTSPSYVRRPVPGNERFIRSVQAKAPPMTNIVILLLQAVSIGLTVYVLLQLKTIFREVRSPVIRQKSQLSGDFKDRLRTLPRPDGQPRDVREGPRGDRPQGDRPQGDRNGNRDDRPRGDRPQGDHPRGDRPRGDRPQGDRPRDDRNGNREDRPRGDRPQGDRPRDDRPREPRPESAPVAEAPAASAPVTESVSQASSGRRPLSAVSSAPYTPFASPTSDALAPSSLAQPVVSDAPPNFGRRQLPKAKPRYDDDSSESSEEKKETVSA